MECYPEVKINELQLCKKMAVLETMLSEKKEKKNDSQSTYMLQSIYELFTSFLSRAW